MFTRRIADALSLINVCHFGHGDALGFLLADSDHPNQLAQYVDGRGTVHCRESCLFQHSALASQDLERSSLRSRERPAHIGQFNIVTTQNRVRELWSQNPVGFVTIVIPERL